MQTITFQVKDTTPEKQPVENVLIRLFKNWVFVTQGYTNDEGVLEKDLDDGTYLMRLSIPGMHGYQIDSPQEFVIDGEDATYSVEAELFQYPAAVDPAYCCCSGYLTKSDSKLSRYTRIYFELVEGPVIAQDSAILNQVIETDTNSKGYISINLLRNAVYKVTIPGMHDVIWNVRIPDKAWAILVHVIYPVVSQADFIPSSLNIEDGSSSNVAVELTYRSGLELSGTELGADWPVEFEYDADIISVDPGNDGEITITAQKPGSTTIIVTRKQPSEGTGIKFFPDEEVSGSLPVTVT